MSYREPTRAELDALDAKDTGISAIVGSVVYEVHGAVTGDVRIALNGTLAYSGACEAPKEREKIDAAIEPRKLTDAERVKAAADVKEIEPLDNERTR